MPVSLQTMKANVICLLAAGLAVGPLAAGCASQARHTLADPGLVPPRGARVELLPVDFYLHVDGLSGEISKAKRKRLNREVNEQIEAWTRRFLDKRGYELGNRITWEGASGAQGYVDGPVIEDIALDILDYVNEAGDGGSLHEEDAVAPQALHALASATGAGAVLYVNGKASVLSSGKRTQRAVIAVCCFVITAAFLYLVYQGAKSSGSSGRGSRPRRPGRPPRGRRVGHRPPRMRPHRAPRRGPRVHVGFYTPIYIHTDHSHPHGGYAMDDAEEEDRELQGDRMWLSFTLVRPQDGRVLWHARQTVNLSATDDEELAQALRDLAHTLPRAPAAPAASPRPPAPPTPSSPTPGRPAPPPPPPAPEGGVLL